MILIAGVPVDYQRLFIIGIGLALVLFLYFFTHYTGLGWHSGGLLRMSEQRFRLVLNRIGQPH